MTEFTEDQTFEAFDAACAFRVVSDDHCADCLEDIIPPDVIWDLVKAILRTLERSPQ